MNKSVEFYDFLQVNANSSDTKCCSSIEEQEENRDDQAEGQVPFIDFLEVGASHRQWFIYKYLTRDASKASCNALWKRHAANRSLTPKTLIEEAKCTVHNTWHVIYWCIHICPNPPWLVYICAKYFEINEELIILSYICKLVYLI